MNGPKGKPKLGTSPLVASLLDRTIPGRKQPAQDKPLTQTNLRLEHKPGGVRIVFSDAITWIGFTPDGADELAKHLTELAALAREPAPEESRIIVPQ